MEGVSDPRRKKKGPKLIAKIPCTIIIVPSLRWHNEEGLLTTTCIKYLASGRHFGWITSFVNHNSNLFLKKIFLNKNRKGLRNSIFKFYIMYVISTNNV